MLRKSSTGTNILGKVHQSIDDLVSILCNNAREERRREEKRGDKRREVKRKEEKRGQKTDS